MTNIYVERIDNALRVLRDETEDLGFNLNAWGACALGHCAKDRWFNSQGFKTRTQNAIPTFEGVDGLTAGAKLFGISPEVSERLFVTGNFETGAYQGRPTRKAVIAQLEVLRMKKLAEIETGGTIEAKDFAFIDA